MQSKNSTHSMKSEEEAIKEEGLASAALNSISTIEWLK